MTLKFKKPKKFKTPIEIKQQKIAIQDKINYLNRIIDEQLSQQVNEKLQQILESREAEYRIEFVNIRKNGDNVLIDIDLVPQHDVHYLTVDCTFTADTWNEIEYPFEEPMDTKREEDYIIIDNGDNGLRIQ